jgi:hypothetical protein
MNDVHRVILIQDEDDLEQSPSIPATPDQPLVVLAAQRKWVCGLHHHPLGFLDRDAMRSDVLDIPVVPAKVQVVPTFFI